MKRYRHYTKERAIILACFGSVIEQQKYLDLQNVVQSHFEHTDVFLSFSSRMVLKQLKKQNLEYRNLPQVLADADLAGYKHMVVASVNLFPTDEHALLKEIVSGFRAFSLSHIRSTNAVLTKTKETTLFLKHLNDKVSKEGVANLYIIHGTPRLDIAGIDSITYSHNFLEALDEQNFCCSLEGSFPFFALKESLIRRMKQANVTSVQIVPLLLIDGNHYENDMFEIKEVLRPYFETSVVSSITQGERFNLIEMEEIHQIIIDTIQEEIIKSGI